MDVQEISKVIIRKQKAIYVYDKLTQEHQNGGPELTDKQKAKQISLQNEVQDLIARRKELKDSLRTKPVGDNKESDRKYQAKKRALQKQAQLLFAYSEVANELFI